MRTSEKCDAIYEVKKRPFLTISLFAHRGLCFPMAILKCNLDLCKTNSSLNWIGRENLIRFVGAPFYNWEKWPCVNFIVFYLIVQIFSTLMIVYCYSPHFMSHLERPRQGQRRTAEADPKKRIIPPRLPRFYL